MGPQAPSGSACAAGLAIGNSEAIRRAHNSFSPPQPIGPEESRAAHDGDDMYHFISYLPVGGTLYELDGLKPGPISLGACTEARAPPAWALHACVPQPDQAAQGAVTGRRHSPTQQPAPMLGTALADDKAACAPSGLRRDREKCRAVPQTLGAPQEDWLERVTPVIQRRIEGYRGEVRFNLMAVIRSRRDALRERVAHLEARRGALEAALPGAPRPERSLLAPVCAAFSWTAGCSLQLGMLPAGALVDVCACRLAIAPSSRGACLGLRTVDDLARCLL